MHVRFDRDFDWPATGPWHTAYKAGPRSQNVKRECGLAAIAAGAAQEAKAPDREEARDGVDASARG